MGKKIKWIWILCLPLVWTGCKGEEYYSTPEKTLARYVDNRKMTTREEYESCLNTFRKEDREWMEKNYMKLCTGLYGPDCPGEGIATLSAVWSDVFEPEGPVSANADSVQVNEEAGSAVLVVNGKEIEFIRHRGNWKIKGLFGAVQKLKAKFPNLDEA